MDLVDQVTADNDKDLINMRDEIQDMWTTCSLKRERRSISSQKVPGFTLVGDNVGQFSKKNLQLFNCTPQITGKVINPRHNTGLDYKGHYLSMAQVLAIDNRVPSAHYRYVGVLIGLEKLELEMLEKST